MSFHLTLFSVGYCSVILSLLVGGVGLGDFDYIYYNDVYHWYDNSGWSTNIAGSTGGTVFTPRYGHRCVEFNSKIFVTGGWDSSGMLSNEVWASGDLGVSWSLQHALPYANAFHSLVAYSGALYFFGDRSDNTEMDLWTNADPSSLDWTRVFFSSTAPPKRSKPTVEVLGGTIYLIAGADSVSGIYNDVWAYNPTTFIWNQFSNIPPGDPNIYPGHCVFDGFIVIIGGMTMNYSTETTTILAFDGTSWSRGPQDPLFKIEEPMVANFRNTIMVMGGDRVFNTMYNEVYVSGEDYARTPTSSSSSSSSSSAPPSSSSSSSSTASSSTVASSSTTISSSTGPSSSSTEPISSSTAVISSTMMSSSTAGPILSTAAETNSGGVSPSTGASSSTSSQPILLSSSSSTGHNEIEFDSGSSSQNLLPLYIILPIVLVILILCCIGVVYHRRRADAHKQQMDKDNLDVETGLFLGVGGSGTSSRRNSVSTLATNYEELGGSQPALHDQPLVLSQIMAPSESASSEVAPVPSQPQK